MPNLSHQAVHQFWEKFDDPFIYRVISFMEATEEWSLDSNPSLEQALEKFGKSLDDINNIDLKSPEDILKIITFIKTGRGLRILMCLDTAYPGAAAKVIMHAEEITKSEKDPAGFFLRRNVVFERLRLLSRVFSEERMELLQKSLEEGNL